MMTSPRRILSVIVLGGWCGLFWFLMATDRVSLYLSSRTDWIVPTGAIILTFATVGRLLALRSREPERISRSDAAGAVLLLIPVVIVLALPPASLGSFAASRRSTLATAGLAPDIAQIAQGEISLIDVGGALRTEEAMAALRDRAGSEVAFTGFVTREGSDPADEFTLNRFIISCCVADALAVKVRVIGAPGGLVEKDDWVKVTGEIYPIGREIAVDASEVEIVPEPKDPYLSP